MKLLSVSLDHYMKWQLLNSIHLKATASLHQKHEVYCVAWRLLVRVYLYASVATDFFFCVDQNEIQFNTIYEM